MTESIHQRLSDRVLQALELSNSQNDADISELLARALEMSLTRGAGGADFVERREFESRVSAALETADKLKNPKCFLTVACGLPSLVRARQTGCAFNIAPRSCANK